MAQRSISVELIHKAHESPLLRLVIQHAPHYREHDETLQRYRAALRRTFHEAGILTPLDMTVDLSVAFINPASTDIVNLLMALSRAMDGKALKGPGILRDDSQIGVIRYAAIVPVP
jgi:hypothetical protein